MEKLFIETERQTLNEAEEILNETGLDISSAIKVMLKRIIREGNATFLFSNNSVKKYISTNSQNSPSNSNEQAEESIKMTKNKAINLFRSKGTFINGNVTFASKNKVGYNYWANPDFSVLENDWFLILNDWIRQDIYLFKIPKDSIRCNNLVARADMKNRIDLQIMYDDSSFTDTRSKISFAIYLTDRISY